MHVRPATISDKPAILHLLSELRQDTTTSAVTDESLLLIIDDPKRTILIAEVDGEPRAMAVLNLVYKLPKVEARIDEVVVSSSARGTGLGTAIIRKCEDWAWQQNADTIEFTSRPAREAANNLYKKLGYSLRNTNVYQKKRAA
jgi:GNAT superfamily N-acetyltransferase